MARISVLPLSPIPDGVWGQSPTLGLDLHWDAGRLWFYDSLTGERLLSYDDQAEAIEEPRMPCENRKPPADPPWLLCSLPWSHVRPPRPHDKVKSPHVSRRGRNESARQMQLPHAGAAEAARQNEVTARQAAEAALRESEAARQREVAELHAQLRRLRARQGDETA